MTQQGFRKAGRDLMRGVNTSLLINLVKEAGRLSRADLARRSNLSPATVSTIVAKLIRSGVLYEVATGQSKGGRPPVILSLNVRAAHVVGIKLKDGGLTTVVTDLNAEAIHSFEVEAVRTSDPTAALDAIEQAFRRALKETGVSRGKVLGVGIGLPGVVDPSEGVVHFSEILRWKDVALQEPLRKRLRVPVWVDNDVNTVAVAEKWFGAGQGVSHFVTVTVGRGVGLGIVIGGEIYRGDMGGAGEFGHMTVVADGLPCPCGRRGCLETIAGEPAIRAAASQLRGRPLDIPEIVKLADAGDDQLVAVLANAGRTLGLALANLVTLLNPERLVITGEGVRLGRCFLDPMRQALQQSAYAGLGATLPVTVEPWGDDAWAVGAATLVLRELFKLPVHGEAPATPLAILAGA